MIVCMCCEMSSLFNWHRGA